ncbi:nucleotidyltransferase [Clostridium akagii]|uniref:nucleotidyltransferase n=1 Tax=Clostridium akagii TaxID=91623 RepID=UPI00047B4519|nr:nucleotidyltransferase [Clostridium akagii]
MNISAIISEYNPIHNGHIYHINNTIKKAKSDGIICVMSGNFVQRGEPSIIDKWNRAKMALLNGIDLVLELPAIYAVSSAEFFAFGAVSLLNNLNVVSNLSFGSEDGDIKSLYRLAKFLSDETDDYKTLLKSYINLGLPYYVARNKAVYELLGENVDDLLKSSNNILGIEYCKSIIKLNSSITPITVKRVGDKYNDEDITSTLPSATALRKHLMENSNLHVLSKFMPDSAYKSLLQLSTNNYDFAYKEKMFKYLKYKCLSSINNIENIPDANEGLHNKIFNSIISSNSLDELIIKTKSKRYSYTRISRIMCQYFIGFENYNTATLRNNTCPYARVLGFNDKGREILKLLKDNSSIPVYSKLPQKQLLDDCLKLDIQASNAYSMINKNVKPMWDYLISPMYLKTK